MIFTDCFHLIIKSYSSTFWSWFWIMASNIRILRTRNTNFYLLLLNSPPNVPSHTRPHPFIPLAQMNVACRPALTGQCPGSPPVCPAACRSRQSARVPRTPCWPPEHATDAGESSTRMATVTSRAPRQLLAAVPALTTGQDSAVWTSRYCRIGSLNSRLIALSVDS